MAIHTKYEYYWQLFGRRPESIAFALFAVLGAHFQPEI